MNHRLRDCLAPLFAALCAHHGMASAQNVVPEPSEFRVSGFGTLGVAHAQAAAGWAYKRDSTQADHAATTRISP